jgi:hypothetical protein
MPMNHDLDALAPALREINERRAAAGREGTTTLTVSGRVGSPADLDRYRDTGVDRLVVMPFTSSRDAIDGIGRFGEEIIAASA